MKTLERAKTIVELRRAGIGWTEIATALGVSRTRVHQIVATAGLQKRARALPTSAPTTRLSQAAPYQRVWVGLWPGPRKRARLHVQVQVRQVQGRAVKRSRVLSVYGMRWAQALDLVQTSFAAARRR